MNQPAQRVASRYLAAKAYDPTDYAMVSAQDVYDRIRHTSYASPNEELDMDKAGKQDGAVMVMKRARAWNLQEFINWLEGFAGAYIIDNLRTDIETKPLMILVKDPNKKMKIVKRIPGTEADFKKIQETAALPGYSGVQGMTIEVEPRSTKADERKLQKLEALRAQRLQEYKSWYNDLRQIKAVLSLVETKPTEVRIHLHDHDVLVGGCQATELSDVLAPDEKPVNDLCLDDLRAQIAKYGPGPVWMVWHAAIEPYEQNHGFGTAMYERMIAEIKQKTKGTVYLVANRCFTAAGGDLTSADAKRVWAVLSRKYPTQGYVLAIT